MIRFELVCGSDHQFEGWFSRGSDCDAQLLNGEIECPACGSRSVRKALMAPAVARPSPEPQMTAEEARMAAALRRKYDPNGRWVGQDFVAEVRRGGLDKSALFGMATQEEYSELIEDGYRVTAVSETDTETLN